MASASTRSTPAPFAPSASQARLEALARETGSDVRTAEQEYIPRAAITRIGEPDDVADLASFILGPRGTLLHGSILDLDAGATKSL